MRYSLKQKLGALVYDLPRFFWYMRPRFGRSASAWLLYRNRSERIIVNEDLFGVSCDWQWTSDLHIAKIFPKLGLSLMRRTLRDWPLVMDSPPPTRAGEDVKLSFIIGHRGRSRVPHLLATLRSIAAQSDVAFECVVVEQSVLPEIKESLPDWVRYVHSPSAHSGAPYSRSLAFNRGAALARGPVLVLHDNDLLAPRDYAAEIVKRVEEGYEVINIKRFIFYLSPANSRRVCVSGEADFDEAPECVMQNAQGGGSLAISRKAYFAIGGFDESFVGWGGEDNEFWERAQTRNVWPYGYMPLVHLWHEAQSDKNLGEDAPAKRKYWELASIPPEERIRNLVQRQTA